MMMMISTSITRGHNFTLFKPPCCVVLMCGSIVLHTGLPISGTACQVILLMLVAFLYLNRILLNLPPLCTWSLHRPVCLIVLLFSFVVHASLSFGTRVSRLLFKINGFGSSSSYLFTEK